MKLEERRKHYRLRLQLPIEIVTPDGKEHLSRISRNISAGGIYFVCPPKSIYKPGKQLNVKIAIPRNNNNKNILNVNATVIRNEPINNSLNAPCVGVACKFNEPLTVAI